MQSASNVHHHLRTRSRVRATTDNSSCAFKCTKYLKAVWAHGYWDIRQNVVEVLIANGLTKLLYKHLVPVQRMQDISVHHHRSV